MTKASEVVNKLQELIDENGDCEINIYKSFDKTTTHIDEEEIHFDDKLKEIYIGIYN